MKKLSMKSTITSEDIARTVRTIRRALNLTQIELSEKLKISQSALSKIEAGKGEMSVLQWFEFCNLAGVAADALIFEAKDDITNRLLDQRRSKVRST